MTFVVLAGAADSVARGLPGRLPHRDMIVVTPMDLSRSGWRYVPGATPSVLVDGDGTLHQSNELTGVVTRLPYVSASELPHIVGGDRAYVASEMEAFLIAWLSELECPVANRPSPGCLCGPFWRPERWIAEAARAGIPVEPMRRVLPPDTASRQPTTRSGTRVTVVGKRPLHAVNRALTSMALKLATATRAETLTVDFSDSGSGARMIAASPWPYLEDDGTADALFDHLSRAPVSA